MKNLAILGVGIAIGYFLFRNSAKIIQPNVILPGDKGKEVEGMQKLMNSVANIEFEQYGQYDADTEAAVLYLMKGTKGLVSESKGAVDKEFATDLARIYFNSKNII